PAGYRIGEIYSTFKATTFQKILAVVLLLMLGAVVACHSESRIALPLRLACWLWLGMWVIRQTPKPYIDVFSFQQEAAQGLLHGQNPYAMSYTNIYGQGSPVYAQDVQKNGNLDFGFPYAPLSLFIVVHGYLPGEQHYAQLFCLALGASLIALSRTEFIATLASILP